MVVDPYFTSITHSFPGRRWYGMFMGGIMCTWIGGLRPEASFLFDY